MQRKTLHQIIGLIWVVLLVRAYLAYDWAKSSYISVYNFAVDCRSGGIVGDCYTSLLAYELANSIFWGIMATVVLYSLIDIEDDDEEE